MESGNDYVLQVKGNQPKLMKKIRETITNSDAIEIDYTLEKNRGRQEARQVYVYEATHEDTYKEWHGIRHIIHIIAKGIRDKRHYEEERYYITNRIETDAREYNKGIRNHWGIENRLHWVKDVILKEDGGLVRNMARCKTLSVLRNIVMNIFRATGHKSIKYAIERYTNRIEECCNLIHGINYI